MKKMFNVGDVYPALLITYANAGMGIMGIFMALAGNHKGALLLLILAALCDIFDGFVARRGHQTTEQKAMGVIADTLADAVSFGVFPAVFLCIIGDMQPLFCAVGTLYLLAVLHRLTIFSVSGVGEVNASHRFIGIPSIAIVVVLPLVYLLAKGSPHVAEITAVCMASLALLYISRLRVPKPYSATAYAGYLLVAALLLAGIAWL